MNEMKPTDNNPNQINARLKAAVQSVDVPPFLEAKIRRHIQEQTAPVPSRGGWTWVTSSAAVAGLAIAGLIGFELMGLRQTAGKQESFIVSVASRVGTLMRVGLGDHIHCAFFRKFPAQAPAVEEMESNLGSEYKDLVPVVRQNVPEQYSLVLGHACRYNGRRFIHLSLKNGSQLMSLVITTKQGSETFDIQGALPELVQSGIPMYTSTTERFQIAAMETSSHLVYFISDLPGKQNTQLLVAMGPSIKAILENLEG
jgi:hypothetical protein